MNVRLVRSCLMKRIGDFRRSSLIFSSLTNNLSNHSSRTEKSASTRFTNIPMAPIAMIPQLMRLTKALRDRRNKWLAGMTQTKSVNELTECLLMTCRHSGFSLLSLWTTKSNNRKKCKLISIENVSSSYKRPRGVRQTPMVCMRLLSNSRKSLRRSEATPKLFGLRSKSACSARKRTTLTST